MQGHFLLPLAPVSADEARKILNSSPHKSSMMDTNLTHFLAIGLHVSLILSVFLSSSSGQVILQPGKVPLAF